MNKNFRRFATLSLSAALVMSNSLAVLAADNERTGTGEVGYEGYVDETSAFTVEVPTQANKQFDFTVDPNGLLAGTDYARLLSETVTAANFDSTANLYFANTHKVEEADVLWYTNSSKPITMTNMSSYDVDVEVTASVTGATGITLVNAAPTVATGDPSLYLAIITDDSDTDKQTIAITSDGGTFDSEIAGVPDNFMIRYSATDEAYQYVQRTNTDTEKKYNKNGDEVATGGENGVALDDWETVSFYLTGKCGGAWTDDQSALEIGVSLTWKVTDPEAAPADAAPSIATTAYTYTSGEGIEVAFDLGSGELAATGIASVVSVKKDGTTPFTLVENTNYTISDNTIVFTDAQLASLMNINSKSVTITFDDETPTVVVITITKA